MDGARVAHQKGKPVKYPFIIRYARAKYQQAPALSTRWRERDRRIPGWDHAAVTIHGVSSGSDEAGDRIPVLEASGISVFAARGRVAPATAEGIKSVVRRLRPQEAAEIDALDERIAELKRQVGELRRERRELVARAWTKANVVRLNEVTPGAGETHRRVTAFG